MDIRAMENYLAVVRAGNISGAAEALHVSQPALSRQMKDLEDELGTTLFERGSRRIRLTDEGMILKRRAEEMIRLMQMTEREIYQAHSKVTGDVRIGSGESQSFHHLSRAAAALHEDYPGITIHVTDGDTQDLMDHLVSGLLDIALIYSGFDRSQFNYVGLPEREQMGVLMRKDDPLAAKDVIFPADLQSADLIVSRASAPLFSSDPTLSEFSIAATYNLIFNASLMVEDGRGYLIGFSGLINENEESVLTFRPLAHTLYQQGYIIWKKDQTYTPAVNLYLDYLKKELAGQSD